MPSDSARFHIAIPLVAKTSRAAPPNMPGPADRTRRVEESRRPDEAFAVRPRCKLTGAEPEGLVLRNQRGRTRPASTAPGSYTCRTPTTELMPEQISKSQSRRASRSGDETNIGAQNSGAITAKYTAMCASAADHRRRERMKHHRHQQRHDGGNPALPRGRRTALVFDHPPANAARLMRTRRHRIGRRNGCVPGRYSSAGSAVWLITNNSANPQGADAGRDSAERRNRQRAACRRSSCHRRGAAGSRDTDRRTLGRTSWHRTRRTAARRA